ncbi:MAG: hypothetical protein V3T14_05055 [Myxococcota bacterium]
MFARGEGPTALRQDLVRALSFSLEDVEVDLGRGPLQARAGLAGVWNRKKGLVVVLVRFVKDGQVERFSFTEPITRVAEVDSAVQGALVFVEGMGMLMGGTEFTTLDAKAQEAALNRWQELRAPAAKAPSKKPAAKSQPKVEAPPKVEVPRASEPAATSSPAPRSTPPEPLAEPDADSALVFGGSTGSVLGRVRVVRKRVKQSGTSDGVGRILSSF